MSIWDEDVIPAPPDAETYATNPTWQAKSAVGDILAKLRQFYLVTYENDRTVSAQSHAHAAAALTRIEESLARIEARLAL